MKTIAQRIQELKAQLSNVNQWTINERRDWAKINILPGAIAAAPERAHELMAQIDSDAAFEQLWRDRLKEYFDLRTSWKVKELETWESIKKKPQPPH